MGSDRIRHLIYSYGRWRWRPTKTMRSKHGFTVVKLSKGGPTLDSRGYPAASSEDVASAIRLNLEWDAKRLGLPEPARPAAIAAYPKGSVGDGYLRAMALRAADRKNKKIVWTVEQQKRDDWPRAWKWLGPEFGDCDPRTIQPENFLNIEPISGDVSGLIPRIEEKASIGERHRVIKVWRALWKRLAAMKYCDLGADPSKAFANTPPKSRNEIWNEGETVRLVKRAIRLKFYGLAALMAVSWDSQLSPIDARSLTPRQHRRDAHGSWFAVARAKSGKAAAATLSARSELLLAEYVASFGADLLPDGPIFRTRGRDRSINTGGKNWLPRIYTKNSLVNDFDIVRTAEFGKVEKRMLSDMRRSGAVEADAGGATAEDLSNKMANTLDENDDLRATYNPVNMPSVRRADAARLVGRRQLREHKMDESVRNPQTLTLLKKGLRSKPLK